MSDLGEYLALLARREATQARRQRARVPQAPADRPDPQELAELLVLVDPRGQPLVRFPSPTSPSAPAPPDVNVQFTVQQPPDRGRPGSYYSLWRPTDSRTRVPVEFLTTVRRT